jgi:DNA-binding NtrC family response regulator
MANILVIDDESILLDLMSTTLRLVGHTVTALSSPLAALGAYQTSEIPIDLLLTDVTTKPISGFDLVRRLSRLGFKGAVLFTSGYPAVSGAIACGLGDRALLEKPFTAQQLRDAVQRALSRGKAQSLHAM